MGVLIMDMNKQPIAWLLAASMSVMQVAPAAMIAVSAAEQAAETLVSAGSVRGKQGETVSVSLSLKGNRGLNAMAVWVSYNADALELVSVSDSGKFGTDAFDAPKELSKSPVRLGWTNDRTANTNDGEVAVLKFRIKDSADDGDYEISLYTREGENFSADFASANPFTDVELAFDDGTVTVGDAAPAADAGLAAALSEDAPKPPEVTNVSVSGFTVKLTSRYEYAYSKTPADNFKSLNWSRNRKAHGLKPNTTYYVYQRAVGTSNVSAPVEITTSKYSISDAIESISIGTSGAEGTVLTPVITYREGFSEDVVGEFTFCWSAKDWADPTVSLADSYTITAEDVANGRDMQVMAAALNCRGLIKSNSFKAGKTDYSGEVRSPAVANISSDGFEIMAQPGYEYVVTDDMNVPEDAVWTSLDSGASVSGKTAGSTLYVSVRVRATETANASEISEPLGVRLPNNDASLQKLTVSSGKITPEFSPEITDYTVSVPYGRSIPRIKTVTASGLSVVETEQAKGFAEGKNKAVISVTAENGVDTKLYTVTFIRQESLEEAADTNASADTDVPASETETAENTPAETPAITSNGTVEPYVNGDPAKAGWNAVFDELTASSDGDSVTVKMNDTTELPKEITEAVQGRDVDLVLKMNNGVTWSVNGLDVTEPKTVNMEVSTASRKSLADMADSLNSERKAVPIKLYGSTDPGFTASMTLNLNDRYNGYYASLYSLNKKTGDAEYRAGSVAENGKVTVKFSELADSAEYAVIFTSEPVTEDVSAKAGISDPSVPIDVSAPYANGIRLPQAYSPALPERSGRKRRYRILRKRRLDDMVFVF